MKDLLVKRYVKIPVFHSPQGKNGHYGLAGFTLAGCCGECDGSAPSHNLGFPVLAVVQSAKEVIAMSPSAQKIKNKLDQLSIGYHLQKGLKKLIGGDVSKAEGMWDAYKPGAGKVLGREYDEREFAEALKGARDTNSKTFSGDREVMLKGIADQIVKGVIAGTIPIEWTAPQIYDSVIGPWLRSTGILKKDPHPLIRQILVDVIDRYINNLPITRADMASFKGQSAYTAHAPLIVDALTGKLPQLAQSAPVDPAKPAIPTTPTGAPTNGGTVYAGGTPNFYTGPAVTPPPISPLAPGLPPPVAPIDQTGALIASLLQQGASQQDTFAAAMRSLTSQGVQATPQVQADVASLVKSGGERDNTLLYVGIGAAVLLVGVFAFSGGSRRGRR